MTSARACGTGFASRNDPKVTHPENKERSMEYKRKLQVALSRRVKREYEQVAA
jgi:hypothetical protein